MKSVLAFRARAREQESVEVDIYDVIGADPFFGGGISAEAVLNAIGPVKAGGRIECRINSIGGIVTEGMAIYNSLVRKRGEGVEVVCRVDSIAGSIASVIAMAGRLEMAEHSFLMIHNPYGLIEGEAQTLRNQANVLDAMREQILDIYAKKAGRGREAISAMMNDGGTYLTPNEALSFGLCDEVIPDPSVMLAAQFDVAKLAKAPAAVRAAIEKMTVRAEAGADEVTRPDLPPARIHADSESFADLGSTQGDEIQIQEPPAPPAPAGAPPMAMTPEETQKLADLETQVATLTASLATETGARASAEEALAKSKSKASDDEEEDDDEEEMARAAVVAEAVEVTGCKDLAKLPGALAALGVKLKNSGGVKDVHSARVKRLLAEGKLPPHMKAKAMAWTPAQLDGFVEMTGGEKFAPVGEEFEAGTEDPKVKAAVAGAQKPVFNAAAIVLSPEEIKVCKGMGTDPEKYLAEKRAEAEKAHIQKFGSAA